jgi:hypothetical protein
MTRGPSDMEDGNGNSMPGLLGSVHPRAADRYSSMLLISILVLAVLTIVYSIWPLWRALFPFEIDVNEGWNAYHADAVGSDALYPDAGSLITNNYPPLSFYVIHALSSLGLDAIAVGRLLSLVSVPITGIGIASCVRALGGTWIAATVAALWYAATMSRFFDVYIGMNDPQLPAIAAMVCALAWFLHRRALGRAAEPAVLLMVLAGFYKHTVVATPIAALIQFATENQRLAARAAILGVGAAAIGLMLGTFVYGHAFLDQLLAPRTYSLAQALGSLGQLQWIAPALIIWALWAWYDRKSRAARFTALYIAVALAAFFVQKFGAGVAANAQFELVAATAIGLGVAFSATEATPFARRFGANTSRLAILGVLIVRLLLSNHVEPYLVLASPEFRRLFHENADVVRREVERVRNIPDAVHCSVITVCRLAGKPFVFDPFAIEQRVKTGKLTPDQVTAAIAARGIRFEQIDSRATAEWASRRIFLNMR